MANEDNVKFTVLGNKGSGKTCYLLGMYYQMCSGNCGYTVYADDDDDIELKMRYQKMCDSEQDYEDRFPAATDDKTECKFVLQYQNKDIMGFDWMDYPGELLTQKSAYNGPKLYADFKENVIKSKSMFIFVDGELLCESNLEKKKQVIKDQIGANINSFISEFARTNNFIPPIGIVLTKYDKCNNYTSMAELEEIFRFAFSSLFVKDGEEDNIVCVIPVSLGEHIEDADYKGELRPINIHFPIFMGIWFEMNDRINKAEELVKSWEKSIVTSQIRLLDLKKQLEVEEDKWWFSRDPKKINNIKKDITATEASIPDITTQVEKKKIEIQNMKKKSQRIMYEIGGIPCFKKGIKLDFKDLETKLW